MAHLILLVLFLLIVRICVYWACLHLLVLIWYQKLHVYLFMAPMYVTKQYEFTALTYN